MLADIRAVTDLCLCIQRSAVQVTGKIMVTMVVQEHARWLSLADLTEHEKPDMIRLWFQKGFFFSALPTPLQGKKEDKVPQLCFPVAAPPRPPQCKSPAAAIPNPKAAKGTSFFIQPCLVQPSSRSCRGPASSSSSGCPAQPRSRKRAAWDIFSPVLTLPVPCSPAPSASSNLLQKRPSRPPCTAPE